MISLTCTSCKKSLEIDDAFAGGVCRCQHCGTIQTVPASLRKDGRPGAPVGTAATVQKTLYRKKTAPKTDAAPAREAGSRQERAAQPSPPPPTSEARSPWPMGVAIGVAAALLIALIVWLIA